MRAIIDHVPPIFGQKNFGSVVAQYGDKSFQQTIKPLEETLRKISDRHLHLHIRSKESTIDGQQLEFKPNFDVLLGEIIIKLVQ